MVPVPSPESVSAPSEGKVVPDAVPASTGLSPFTELLRRAWGVYKKRWVTLTILNLVSYLPHAICIGFLLAAYFGLKTSSTVLHSIGAAGQYSDLFFIWLLWYALPKWILALLIAAVIVCLVLWYLVQAFGLVQYLLLELAYVYALADETIGAWGAIKKARTRLRGFFWVELYRTFIVSNAGVLWSPVLSSGSGMSSPPSSLPCSGRREHPSHRSGRAGSWSEACGAPCLSR